jgi:hypothetical protein
MIPLNKRPWVLLGPAPQSLRSASSPDRLAGQCTARASPCLLAGVCHLRFAVYCIKMRWKAFTLFLCGPLGGLAGLLRTSIGAEIAPDVTRVQFLICRGVRIAGVDARTGQGVRHPSEPRFLPSSDLGHQMIVALHPHGIRVSESRAMVGSSGRTHMPGHAKKGSWSRLPSPAHPPSMSL